MLQGRVATVCVCVCARALILHHQRGQFVLWRIQFFRFQSPDVCVFAFQLRCTEPKRDPEE